MRLSKFLAHATGLSRSLANKAIRQGRVKVEGVVCKDVALQINSQQVLLDSHTINANTECYIALYKPIGYVCSNVNELMPSALNLIKEATFKGDQSLLQYKRLLSDPMSYPLSFAGRLDQDTTGLILISTDGKWTHNVTSPNHSHGKVYRVELAERISDAQITILEEGVMLNHEKKTTKPCNIKRLSGNSIAIELFEGKYHQVKRMLASQNNRVVKLHRESIGSIILNGLGESEWRFLTKTEREQFN